MKVEITSRERTILLAMLKLIQAGGNKCPLDMVLGSQQWIMGNELQRLENTLYHAQFQDELPEDTYSEIANMRRRHGA